MNYKPLPPLLTLVGIVTVCQAVKVTNIHVPAAFTIDKARNETDMLILDCDYDFFHNESGFVLKWLFNDQQIYQWIPNQKPSALPLMKGLLNLTYEASTEPFFKHKSLWITKTSWNLTGEYTCHVQTFQSSDKKSGRLQIIVPESKFELKHKTDDSGVVSIVCKVSDIFPKPDIIVEFNENDVYRKVSDVDIQTQRDDDGLYTVLAQRKVQISQMLCPTTIRCTLSLLGTNYTRRVETIFYGE
ncbi:hypothetical protein HA402_004838 [Bradysia odoriphaga]|nr:hypothetical protein HA402_004838 [Bradysia odoriphaga]